MLISVLIFATFPVDDDFYIKDDLDDDDNDELYIKDDLVVDTNHFHLLTLADQ